MLEKMIKMQTAKQEKMLENWLRKREQGYSLPESVILTENVDYMGDGLACHRMDIYQPSAGQGFPVLVNIHGGGFLLGKKEVNRQFCADMCQRGFLVFCLEYPLVPQVSIFEIFRDLTAGINKVGELAEKYNGDISRLCLCGDSAGAYLCVYLAAMQRSLAIAEAAGVAQIVPPIRAIGLISGMFYTKKRDQIGMFLPNMVYGQGWRRGAFAPYIDPENRELVGSLTPSFIVTARGDFLRHYSRQFAAALGRAGAPHQFLDIDAGKKLSHAFSAMLPEIPESRQANDAMAEYLLANSHGVTTK